MPWKQVEPMLQRKELIEKLLLRGANVSALCEEQGISRKTAYKWLARYREAGLNGLKDKSKAPRHSPYQTDQHLEALIIETHKAYPYWGPRKLRHFLLNEHTDVILPAVSTFSRVLRREGCEVIKNNRSAPATKRFERKEANELWQMDFKGSFMTQLHRCYPLTIIDDYSRYSIGLNACRNERRETVKTHLIHCFKTFGLPKQMNVDNGSPWGSADLESVTTLAVWLMKCGVRLSHSSPYHPQTNGKDERFHRTLKLELLHNNSYRNCSDIQRAFDEWRHLYNYKRPHDALEGKPPCDRYVESSRRFSDKPMSVEYDSSEVVRKVHLSGMMRFKGKRYRVGKGLSGEYVVVRETDREDEYSIFFMDLLIKKITTARSL